MYSKRRHLSGIQFTVNRWLGCLGFKNMLQLFTTKSYTVQSWKWKWCQGRCTNHQLKSITKITLQECDDAANNIVMHKKFIHYKTKVCTKNCRISDILTTIDYINLPTDCLHWHCLRLNVCSNQGIKWQKIWAPLANAAFRMSCNS